MKTRRLFTVMSFVLLVSSLALAQSNAQKVLERFKAMAGTWEGKSPTGETSEVTYSVVAGGTSVMAQIHMGSEGMMSMFYVDGDQLLMTHFCPSNNQPRMKAIISPDLKTVTFDFLDATGLPGPQAGHMHRAVYVFTDPGHYSEEWTWRSEGKNIKFQFEMQRKK